MRRAKPKELKRGDVFAVTGKFKRGDRLYVCVRTRRPDEKYCGYVMALKDYEYASNNLVVAKQRGNDDTYNFYPNFYGRYLEINKKNTITIFDKGEIELMNLGR